MGVRTESVGYRKWMAEMDPAATKSVTMSGKYQDYSLSQSLGNPSASKRNDGDPPIPLAPAKSTASLIKALELAADHTATGIAHGTKQARVEVRERLNEVIAWLSISLRSNAPAPVPPVIAREYVSMLKVN